jgi:carbon storage regulator
MLVLTRKTNEKILIGPNVVITVVEIRGDKVRLGIEAPKHITVDREEVATKRAVDPKKGGEPWNQ